MPLSDFKKKLAAITEDQFVRFHLFAEMDPELCSQIKKYWEDLGLSFESCTDVPWSAVFVSWCMKQAGAKASEFKFAAAHSVFVFAAIQNAINNTGVFRGLKITDHKPQIGDIIQHNRSGNHFDYKFAKLNKNYESHSAIVIEVGQDHTGPFALTVGGNESNSVRKSIVRLTDDGHIKQRAVSAYIAVIQNLK